MNAIFPVQQHSELAPIETEVARTFRGRLWRLAIEHGEGGIVHLGVAPSHQVKQPAQPAVGQRTQWPDVRNEIEVT